VSAVKGWICMGGIVRQCAPDCRIAFGQKTAVPHHIHSESTQKPREPLIKPIMRDHAGLSEVPKTIDIVNCQVGVRNVDS
jgi:hypothetical protein